MGKFKVFVDGSEGTTGLKIHSYLEKRNDIEVLRILPEKRKESEARLELISKADISFLCLPDAASREIAEATGGIGKIIDASTAHRVRQGWIYGMPELCAGQREKIRGSRRVAVPGCHATGFILAVRPLIELGIIDPEYPFTATSVTGYSGGGKKMIEQYEKGGDEDLSSPRQYGLTQRHKHLKEMKAMANIHYEPVFMPIVAGYFSGMAVSVPLHNRLLKKQLSPEELKSAYEGYFQSEKFVSISGEPGDTGYMNSHSMSGRNDLFIHIYGNDERMVVTARFDNLGKGASGAAVQCMNLMLGIEETTGLI